MKKILYILLAAAAVSVSCAREGSSDSSALNAEALAAYMQKYHSDAQKTSLGAYIYPGGEESGSGAALGSESYIRINITTTDRDGRLKSSTLESVNRSNNNYNRRNYYGPVIYYRGNDNLSAGLEQILTGEGTGFGPMRTGGTRQALVPAWLASSERYGTEEEYINNFSGGSHQVYTITLVDAFDDVEAWEKDSLSRYVQANYPDAVEDTLLGKKAWYCFVTKPEPDAEQLSSGAYCNYILRDLSGRVIDSSIEKIARDNGFYSSSASYGPKLINWNSDYTQITMGSSGDDVVDGFANAFLHLRRGETGVVMFWSGLGYTSRGSGSSIPAYCPLSFEIEVTEQQP